MERPLKKDARETDRQTLAPVAEGWHVAPGGPALPLAELAPTLPAAARIALQLPSNAVVLERMTLPATDPAELLGMARLQLEKTLPFPEDEVSSEIAIIHSGETETTLLAVAVHHGKLEDLCAPLIARAIWPAEVTIHVLELARACPPDATVLLITRELGGVVLAVVEQAHLSFAQTIEAADLPMVLAELPQVLMGAEMEGVPGDFTRIVLTPEAEDLRAPLADFFRLPTETLRAVDPEAAPGVNLLPEPWLAARRKLSSRAHLQRNLIFAGLAYLVLLLGAFVYLIALDLRARSLQRKVALNDPQVQALAQQQTHWKDLEPAVEPKYYTVELLNQIAQCLPSEELRITQLTTTPTQISVEAEAPSVNAAIDFGERLKANAALKPFRFSSSAPTILANNRAQVRIFGKL